jgi:hypothetical protein
MFNSYLSGLCRLLSSLRLFLNLSQGIVSDVGIYGGSDEGGSGGSEQAPLDAKRFPAKYALTLIVGIISAHFCIGPLSDDRQRKISAWLLGLITSSVLIGIGIVALINYFI